MPPKSERGVLVSQEEQREGQAQDLVRRVFVGRKEFLDADPISVAALGSLQQELELGGSIKDGNERRKVATTASGGLLKGSYDGVFGTASGISILQGTLSNTDKTALFYRSDITQEEARKRYQAYTTILQEKINPKRKAEQDKRDQEEARRREKKATSKAQKQKRENVPKAEEITPEAFLVVFAYQQGSSEPEMQERIEAGKMSLQDRLEQKGKSVEVQLFLDAGAQVKEVNRFLLRSDIKKIVKEGITKEELKHYFPYLREKIIGVANDLENQTAKAAEDLVTLASSLLGNNERTLLIATTAHRPTALALVKNIRLYTDDPRIGVDYDIGNHQNFYDYPPYPVGLLQQWHARFYNPQLEGYKDVLTTDSRLSAQLLLGIIKDEQRESLISALNTNGEVLFNGERLTLADTDELLSPLVLTDDVLARAVWYDVLAELYPAPFAVAGQGRERNFIGLRLIADQFSLDEVYSFLAPDSIDPSKQGQRRIELEEAIGQKDQVLRGLNQKDKAYRTKREMLQQAKSALVREMRGIDEGIIALPSVTEKITRAMQERILQVLPLSKDYLRGEESVGYKRAKERYERIKEKRPDLLPPDPGDYTQGEKSRAYESDYVLHKALKSASALDRDVPEKKIRDYVDGLPDASILVLPILA